MPLSLDDGRLGVPQNFIECDRDQGCCCQKVARVATGQHLAWFVIDPVAEMDLGAFYAADREDGCGRAFDPQMMVCLLLYAFCDRRELGAQDRAPLPRRHRLPRHLRQPRSDHVTDRALPPGVVRVTRLL